MNYKRGTWAIFSDAGCSTAIRDVRLTAKRMGTFLLTITPEHRTEFAELMRLFGLWMLFIDAPEHTRLRKLMNRGFSPAVVESLRPQVETIVGRMLEPLMQVTEADLMQAIAYPLPMRIIAEMLRIPHTMEAWLLACTEVIAHFFGAPNQHRVETLRPVERAVLELMQFFRGRALGLNSLSTVHRKSLALSFYNALRRTIWELDQRNPSRHCGYPVGNLAVLRAHSSCLR